MRTPQTSIPTFSAELTRLAARGCQFGKPSQEAVETTKELVQEVLDEQARQQAEARLPIIATFGTLSLPRI